MSNVTPFLQSCQDRVSKALSKAISEQTSDYAHDSANHHALQTLLQACDYSLSNGGKRLRPALFFATVESLSAKVMPEDQDLIATAIECIHSYSLVHDDLPAMDDDALRRGKPTCHIAYNEATAILVGDGLQARAFELITATSSLPPATQVALIKTLAQAAGNLGMVGGQQIDLMAENTTPNIESLELMHHLKTGAMIHASVKMAAIACNADNNTLQHLEAFARDIGLAFQVQDDIIDIESDTETLGKTQGADLKNNKATYPSLLGMDGAKAKAQDLIQSAKNHLAALELSNSTLSELADFITQRNH